VADTGGRSLPGSHPSLRLWQCGEVTLLQRFSILSAYGPVPSRAPQGVHALPHTSEHYMNEHSGAVVPPPQRSHTKFMGSPSSADTVGWSPILTAIDPSSPGEQQGTTQHPGGPTSHSTLDSEDPWPSEGMSGRPLCQAFTRCACVLAGNLHHTHLHLTTSPRALGTEAGAQPITLFFQMRRQTQAGEEPVFRVRSNLSAVAV
jgi:hypothetical protein